MCQVCMGIDRAGKIKIGSGGKAGKLKGKGKSTDKVKSKFACKQWSKKL